MFGALKRLFSKLGQPASEAGSAPTRPTPVRVPAPGTPTLPGTNGRPAEAARPSASPQTPGFQRAPVAPAAPPPAAAPAARPASASVIPRAVVRLPLDPILARMPTTLTALVRRTEMREVAIPLAVVTGQLNSGAVRVTFGEFRKFAPEGTFADNPINDQVVIELPLKDVLARLSPQLLIRRPQRRIEVPDTVTSVFGPAATTTKATESQTSMFRRAAAERAVPGAAAAPAPAPAVPVPAPVPEVPSLSVVVTAVYAPWPDAIRGEIEKYGLQQAALVIPLARLEPALKLGKVTFPWAEVASWLKPGLPASVTPDPAAWVDLPLAVIAPMFLSRMGGAKKPRKQAAAVDEMPDLFTGKAEVPSQVPVPSHSMPANLADLVPQPVPFTPKPALAVEAKGDSIADILSALYKPDWSPLDLVSKTALLSGALGALLATRDGLLVADKLPPHLNPETMSAFLPQMFSRMNQYSTELQLGPLSSMTLMMGAVPCMILEAGSLYLIVLGRAGAQLPIAQIQQIAAELAKRNP